MAHEDAFEFEAHLSEPKLITQGQADDRVLIEVPPQEFIGQQPGNYRKNYKKTVCTYWLRGMCMKGDQCGFLHQYDTEKMPICRNILKYGECKELDCPYKHDTEEIKECNMYKLGFCIYGPQCRFRHKPSAGPPPPVETLEAAKPREFRDINRVVNSVNPGVLDERPPLPKRPMDRPWLPPEEFKRRRALGIPLDAPYPGPGGSNQPQQGSNAPFLALPGPAPPPGPPPPGHPGPRPPSGPKPPPGQPPPNASNYNQSGQLSQPPQGPRPPPGPPPDGGNQGPNSSNPQPPPGSPRQHQQGHQMPNIMPPSMPSIMGGGGPGVGMPPIGQGYGMPGMGMMPNAMGMPGMGMMPGMPPLMGPAMSNLLMNMSAGMGNMGQ